MCLGRQGNVIQAQHAHQAYVMLLHVPLQGCPSDAAGDLLQSLHNILQENKTCTSCPFSPRKPSLVTSNKSLLTMVHRVV